MPEQFDLIVLGAGSAARDGAAKAKREHGANVAMVERERWGGSCPNVACRPTKAYLTAAELFHDISTQAERRGIDVSRPAIDMRRLRAWKDSIRRDQESWRELLSSMYTTVPGEASFVDEQTVRVGDRTLSAERILIATGGRTAVPPIPGIEDVGWIDHVGALDLDRVPESLLVIGAGPVGLEFAQIFARFGSRVTIVCNRPQIAARADAEAANELQAAFEDEGIEVIILADGGVERFRRNGGAIEATLSDGRTIEITDVLLAAGRVANIEALGLDRIGADASPQGITVDPHQRTTVDGVWAAGDCALGPMFTPTAQYQARIAIDDMFDGSRNSDYSILPTAIFTDPELGSVGLTEHEARANGYDVDVVKHPLASVTRAQFSTSRRGLFKIVFDRVTRKVLGVHVVSRGASDIVGSLALALKLDVTVDDMALVHHVYPSYSEGLKAAAEQALTPVRV